MKLLLDQGLPRTTASILRQDGLDIVHVGEVGLANAADVLILEKARLDDRAVVTLDADFHRLLASQRGSRPSVIRIRVEGLRAQTCADLINRIVASSRSELQRGAALS